MIDGVHEAVERTSSSVKQFITLHHNIYSFVVLMAHHTD